MTRSAKTDQDQGWVLIVEDHPLFSDALDLTFRSVLPGVVVKTADSLEKAEAILQAEASFPQFVALDLNLPDVTGMDGVLAVRRSVPDVPVIVISSLNDPRVISAVVAAGAMGFVPKHSGRDVFGEAIDRIGRGGTYFPELPDSAREAGAEAAERLALLTAQQARILQLICEGKLNKQIAFDLSIAETTVKAHITAIMRKLGVQSRTQAVLVAQDARFSTILSDPDSSPTL